MILVELQYEPASLDTKEVCLMRNRKFLIHVKNQEKVKASLNGVDVGHAECLSATRSKPWDTFNYWI